MLGPAFVAAIAYVDPGNFATNIQGGSEFGYRLLWVVLIANVMAMLIQYLSAKLGIVTGRDLPESCRTRYGPATAAVLWVQAEIVAMATDLAEFVGAAIGLNLIFGIPMFPAALITAALSFAVLALQSRGYRRFELAIAGLLGLIIAGFLYQTLKVGPSAHQSLAGLAPSFAGKDSVVLAVGIIGATAMPHVIYLHSALTARRVRPVDGAERRQLLRFERYDVVIALTVAGLANMAMLAIAAKLFYPGGGVSTLQDAHEGIADLVGGGAALAFAVALLASGISSSGVGTLAGQVVMSGFIRARIPLYVRRVVTMAPAIVVLGIGVNATEALVWSQVMLSFGIPFALIPLVMLTGNRAVMGEHANGRVVTVMAVLVTAVIVGLNLYLIQQQLL
jgi:manganese transport protein